MRTFFGVMARFDRRSLLGLLFAFGMMATATLSVAAFPSRSGADEERTVTEVKLITLKDGKDPNGGMPLLGGGSATPFTLDLPVGASCPGDSAEGGYRVQGYFVSEPYSPTSLEFGSNGPVPVSMGTNVLQPLFEVTTTASYVNIPTAKADVPKGPGLVLSLPAFNFAVFSKGNITPGTYNVGIACTLGPASRTQVKRAWNSRLTIETDESDPVGVRWVAISGKPSNPDPTTPGAPTSANPTAQSRTTSSDPTKSSSSSGSSISGAAKTVAGSQSKKAVSQRIALSADPKARGAVREKFGGQPTSPHVLELVFEAIPTDPSSWPTAAQILVPLLLAGIAVRGIYLNRSKFIPLISRHPAEVTS